MVDEDELKSESSKDALNDCQNFCRKTAKYSPELKENDDLCCDYEEWSDGTYNCYLYKGEKTVKQSNFSGFAQYSSFTFKNGQEIDGAINNRFLCKHYFFAASAVSLGVLIL